MSHARLQQGRRSVRLSSDEAGNGDRIFIAEVFGRRTHAECDVSCSVSKVSGAPCAETQRTRLANRVAMQLTLRLPRKSTCVGCLTGARAACPRSSWTTEAAVEASAVQGRREGRWQGSSSAGLVWPFRAAVACGERSFPPMRGLLHCTAHDGCGSGVAGRQVFRWTIAIPEYCNLADCFRRERPWTIHAPFHD